MRDELVLRRVRQLGSAHDGLREWRLQRLTAIALIPLGLYFVTSILWLAKSDQATAAAWLGSPVPALLVILFVLVTGVELFKQLLEFGPRHPDYSCHRLCRRDCPVACAE